MNRLGKNELMLGQHYTLDQMIEHIEQVTADDVNKVLDRMFSEPFALSMVGASDSAVKDMRRDYFVNLRGN